MIRLQTLELARGTKSLFEQVDLSLNPGDKIGLIGSNGAGKSSLFAMLRGEIHPDQGSIDFQQNGNSPTLPKRRRHCNAVRSNMPSMVTNAYAP